MGFSLVESRTRQGMEYLFGITFLIGFVRLLYAVLEEGGRSLVLVPALAFLAPGGYFIWLARGLSSGFVEVTEGKLRGKKRRLFDQIMPLALIKTVREVDHPVWWDPAVMTNFRGTVALVAGAGTAAELELKYPVHWANTIDAYEGAVPLPAPICR